MRLLIATVAALGALMAPAGAEAAQIHIEPDGTMRYIGEGTESNDGVVSFDSNSDRIVVTERNPAVPLNATGPCSVAGRDASCPVGSLARVRISLNEGVDVFAIQTDRVPIALGGGAGSDVLNGGRGDDSLTGGDGDDVMTGGAGHDVLDSGTGDDVMVSAATTDGPDVFMGGAGSDRVDLSARTAGMTITLDGHPNDGEPGEIDNVVPDVEHVIGGQGNDQITGSANGETLDGGGGADNLDGGGGADTLLGGAGVDLVTGGADDDLLDGGEGGDTVMGGDGNDTVSGGAGEDPLVAGGSGDDTLLGWDPARASVDGADTLDGGAGTDTLSGGSGDDVLSGGPGVDTIHGGDGADRASFADLGLPIVVSWDGLENDGPVAAARSAASLPAETDKLMADVEGAIGGEFDDDMVGSEIANPFEGGGGEDLIAGGRGADDLDGGSGADVMRASDRFAGDIVKCGAGVDLAIVDRGERTQDCEHVSRAGVRPRAGRTFLLSRAKGRPRFGIPSMSRTVGLGETTSLPMLSKFDAGSGVVTLRASTRRGRLDRATFGVTEPGRGFRASSLGGVVSVRDGRLGRARVTEVRLDRARAANACAASEAATSAARTTRRSRRVVQRVWGSGRGRFRTRGRFSAATIRGTTWLTEERCDGTLVRVRSGSVRVDDFARRRVCIVRRGGSYLSTPRGARPRARRASCRPR